MLTPEGHVKVMDFGLAKRVTPVEGQEQEITTALTEQGATLGTVPYMSPEQVRGQVVDTRSDIFSFGVVLYEMLSGVNPFKKGSAMDTATAILGEIPPPLTRYTDNIPVLLQHTVRKMLAKEPERRYQLIHDVRTNLGDLMDEIADSPIEVEEAGIRLSGASAVERPWRQAIPWGVAGLIVVIATFALWTLWRIPPRSLSRSVITLPQGQTLQELSGSPVVLSPDGRQLVYVARQGDNTRLYRRPIDEFEAKPIPGTEGASAPFFSPDGEWVGFFAEDQLKKVSHLGAAPLIISDLQGVRVRRGKTSYGVAGNWAADDTILFSDYFTHGIWRVPASGGTSEPVTAEAEVFRETDLDEGDYFPQLLPGGKMVLLTSDRGGTDLRVAVHSLETGERRIVIEPGSSARYLPTGHLIYAWEGNLLAAPFDLEELQVTGPSVLVVEGVMMVSGTAPFSVSESGSLVYVPGGERRSRSWGELVWVDREGTVEPLPLPTGSYWGPRLSPDGRSFVYWTSLNAETINVWVYELEREVARRLTDDQGGDQGWPIWSPDGKRVIFNGPTEGMGHNLYWKPVDGSGPAERLTESEYGQQAQSYWAGGNLLVFLESHDPADTGTDIWVLPLEGEAKPRPFLQTTSNEFHPMFSPDGRWLAYVSDESGGYEVYVRPYPGPGGVTPISTHGGTDPAWAPDGRELFYLEGRSPSTKLMAVSVKTEPALRVGKPRLLFAGNYMGGSPYGRSYDITPDGQRFLMAKQEQTEVAQINVVLNWFEELKRLVPTP